MTLIEFFFVFHFFLNDFLSFIFVNKYKKIRQKEDENREFYIINIYTSNFPKITIIQIRFNRF